MLPPLCFFTFTGIFVSDRILGLKTLVVSSPTMKTFLVLGSLFAAAVDVAAFCMF